MTVRANLVRIVVVSLVASTIASTADAQLFRRYRGQRNTTQRIQPRQDVDRNVTEDAIPNEARVRTQVDNSVSPNAAVDTQTNVNVLRSTQIVGSMVNIRGQQRVGRVTEVIFNDSGCASYIVVDINGRMAAMPWHIGRFDNRARAFVLDDFDQARIAQIPTFTDFGQLSNQTFVTQVNDFFGVQARTDLNVRGNAATRNSINAETPRATREGAQNQDRATTDADRTAPSDRQPGEAADQPTPRTNEDTGNPANPTDKSDVPNAEQPQQPSSPDREPASPEIPAAPSDTPQENPGE